MKNLQALATNVLIDMLARQTAELTAKIAEKDSVEIRQYEYEISMIQAELNSRQQRGNTKITNSDIDFSSGTN